jgi:hypothetical protein
MAAPNLKSPYSITGKFSSYACTTSLAQALINNSGSNKAFRVNVIRAANVGTSGSVTVEISVYRGTTHSYIVKGATIAQGSSFVVLQRDEYLYLEEGDSIYAKASAATSVDLQFSYEEWMA